MDLDPNMVRAMRALETTDQSDDGMRFWRGVLVGALLVAPFWMAASALTYWAFFGSAK